MIAISSTQNPYIKNILKLQEKSRERKKQGLFIIEGKREISLAIKGKYKFEAILYNKDLITENEISHLFDENIKRVEISKEVYQKIAYRDSTEGIVAVAKTKTFSIEDIHFKNNKPLILIAEAPEKPGNIGAMLRTADAANIDAVFIAEPKTDLYNSNIIRSSIGCVFTNQIATGTSKEIISYLKKNKIKIYSTTLQNSNEYHREVYKDATAIVVGAEAKGLTEIWRENSTRNINIPMLGQIDSMNVSVAAAIVIFEVKRQQKFI